ncbi:LysR family transcriptional regulator [Thioalkalivibrio sp. XN279]|nr:LysR family transcriptional regulator [Thioalkalivibrio sp. XN279]
MKMKLRQIAHALAVSRHGGFRRAAEAQHLSQPALSRSIHNLEEALGVPLFDRESSEVTLTPYGEVFLRRAEAILAEAAELEREMSAMKGLGVGRLAVGMSVTAARLSGVRAVARLLGEYPGLQARLETRTCRDVERRVRNRQVDIGFGEIGHLHDVPELEVEAVARHEMVFYCRTGHPLLDRDDALSHADLDEYPFAGIPIPFRLARLFPHNRHLDPDTGELFPPILVEDLHAACNIVAGTDALGVAVPLLLEPWLQQGELAVLPFRRPWLRVDYGFITLASRAAAPAVERFKDQVRELELEVVARNEALLEDVFQAAAPAA